MSCFSETIVVLWCSFFLVLLNCLQRNPHFFRDNYPHHLFCFSLSSDEPSQTDPIATVVIYKSKKEMTFWSSPFLIEYILESSLDLFDCVGLDYVADLDVVVALDVKTAVHAHVNLLDIILESLE